MLRNPHDQRGVGSRFVARLIGGLAVAAGEQFNCTLPTLSQDCF
jgi:hypothetical protein